MESERAEEREEQDPLDSKPLVLAQQCEQVWNQNDAVVSDSRGKRSWRRLMIVLVLLLLIPIVPVLLLGTTFEERLSQWLDEQVGWQSFALGGGALLAIDIALPVPASTVITALGARLGISLATLVSLLGMTAGAIVGFAVARGLGMVGAERLSRSEDLLAAQRWVARYGPLVLVVARGLPVVGEATVLAMGLLRLSWSRFLPAVLLANGVLSLVYASVGSWAAQQGWLPVALGLVTALPLLPLLGLKWLRYRTGP